MNERLRKALARAHELLQENASWEDVEDRLFLDGYKNHKGQAYRLNYLRNQYGKYRGEFDGTGSAPQVHVKTEHLKFRKSHSQFVRHHSDPEIRKYLTPIEQHWEELSKTVFDNELTGIPAIRLRPVNRNQVFVYRELDGNGSEGAIDVPPELFEQVPNRFFNENITEEGRTKFIQDALLHAMARQLQHERHGKIPGSNKYGETFRNICNEVGEKLGLLSVYCRHEKEGWSILPCSKWPFVCRIARTLDYYDHGIQLSALGFVTGDEVQETVESKKKSEKRSVRICEDFSGEKTGNKLISLFDEDMAIREVISRTLLPGYTITPP